MLTLIQQFNVLMKWNLWSAKDQVSWQEDGPQETILVPWKLHRNSLPSVPFWGRTKWEGSTAGRQKGSDHISVHLAWCFQGSDPICMKCPDEANLWGQKVDSWLPWAGQKDSDEEWLQVCRGFFLGWWTCFQMTSWWESQGWVHLKWLNCSLWIGEF